MPEASTWLLFLTAGFVLLVVPGPAVLFVVTRSVQHGRGAGLTATLGLAVGGLAHVAAVVLGLSALVAASPAAFHVLRLAGAAYLIFLGFRALRGPSGGADSPSSPRSGRQHFRDGLVVNLLNPKAAIFFLAFLPQFADPSSGPMRPQLAALGFAFVALALITDGAFALLGAWVRRWLVADGGSSRTARYLPAAIYFGLGIFAAVS